MLGFFKSKPKPKSNEQAVLIHLNGTDLPDSVYEQYDLKGLDELLSPILKKSNLGEYDGEETGPQETVVFLYGPDAEKLFAGIESALRSYPLCQKSRVVIRQGPPGAAEREVRLD